MKFRVILISLHTLHVLCPFIIRNYITRTAVKSMNIKSALSAGKTFDARQPT